MRMPSAIPRMMGRMRTMGRMTKSNLSRQFFEGQAFPAKET
jgi:hypothetical protein